MLTFAMPAGGGFECTLTPGSGWHLDSLIDNTANVTSQVSANKYTVTNVTADHDLQATFLQNLVLRITSTSVEIWYTLIQSAYDAATNGDDILTLSSDFGEFLEFDRPVSITLQGGCSPDFNTITGCTTLNGDLTISNGTVVIDNLIIK